MTKSKPQVVIAICPTQRSFGFCIFNGQDHLVDWGYSEFRFNKTKRMLNKINVLISMYQPTVAILQDTSDPAYRRHAATMEVTETLTQFFIDHNIPVSHLSNQDVLQAFPNTNKETRAKQIAKALPDIEAYLPPKRKLWDREHNNSHIFDALSLALTHYYLEP